MIAEQQQSVAHLTGTTRSIYAPSFDYDVLMPDADAPKLVHPGKERPRLRKANFVKRPVIACEILLADDAVDVDSTANLQSLSPADKTSPYDSVSPVSVFAYLYACHV